MVADFLALRENVAVYDARGVVVFLFLDCRQLGFSSQKRLNSFFVDKARLALNSGDMFGHEGTGYMRMNVGCPRAVVEEAMERLASACRSIVDAE